MKKPGGEAGAKWWATKNESPGQVGGRGPGLPTLGTNHNPDYTFSPNGPPRIIRNVVEALARVSPRPHLVR